MLRGKYVRVIIAIDGACSVDAMNFTGPSCQTATQEITTALGGDIVGEHLKREARMRESIGQAGRERAR
jgi:hypothetical protein